MKLFKLQLDFTFEWQPGNQPVIQLQLFFSRCMLNCCVKHLKWHTDIVLMHLLTAKCLSHIWQVVQKSRVRTKRCSFPPSGSCTIFSFCIIQDSLITKQTLFDFLYIEIKKKKRKVGLSRRLWEQTKTDTLSDLNQHDGGRKYSTRLLHFHDFRFQNECANTLNPHLLYKSEQRKADK